MVLKTGLYCTCKNRTERGKGLESSTNEAFILWIEKLNWGISKTLFVCQCGYFKHRYSTEGKKFKKIICLHSKDESNSCKELKN